MPLNIPKLTRFVQAGYKAVDGGFDKKTEEIQETARERAARHCQERRDELTFSVSDYDKLEVTRQKVLANQGKSVDDVNRIVTNWLFPLPVSTPQNVIMDGVFVWVETFGTGHVLLTVHNQDITMFSYGRYDDIYPNTAGTKGDGVLIKSSGDECHPYLRYQLYENNVKVFQITDAMKMQVFEELNNSWELSDELPDSTKSQFTLKNGRVIDSYDLFENNCTTKIVDALKASGSKVFDSSFLGVKFEEDFSIPRSLGKHLEESSETFDMVVIDVTSKMKSYLANIDELQIKKPGTRDMIYQSGTSSATVLGELSGYSISSD
ncbi:hypothetical protein ACTFQF_10660 [Aliivibrio fischeri]|uniref:hypothetical protein n=1 Tax=Aliivibrio fischeri TaxID=668 RepID=UPI0007C4BC4E|nr:hypothetical protein [Aliivibrio fischeri]MBP3141584.1 hypothetical protein [Aliivibrio fischeri]MBP3157797.1 hypothetical protein [Aliivibrio fischeri]MCE7572572.1 hypothetical protein [Aliivibrio fischeri]